MKRFVIENTENIGWRLMSLYETVAAQMGEDWSADNIRFDCTKINVSKHMYAKMEAAAVEELGHKYDEESIRNEFAMMWCMSGPKAIDGLARNEVEVFDGFVTYEEATHDD